MLVNALRHIFWLVGDEDESPVGLCGVLVDELLGAGFVGGVETVERLVKYQKVRVFNHRAGEKHKTLLAVGGLQERTVGKMTDAKCIHYFLRLLVLRVAALAEKSLSIKQSRSDNFFAGLILTEIQVHLRRNVTDAFFDVPDALARASFAVKKCNVHIVTTWIVSCYKAKESRFAATVRA